MILMSYILQRRESSGFFFFRPDVSKFRKQIIVKHKNGNRSRELFSRLLKQFGKTAKGKITISADINPSDM